MNIWKILAGALLKMAPWGLILSVALYVFPPVQVLWVIGGTVGALLGTVGLVLVCVFLDDTGTKLIRAGRGKGRFNP